jgi:hypothetical protein
LEPEDVYDIFIERRGESKELRVLREKQIEKSVVFD